MIEPHSDEFFMRQALQEANLALEANEVPVGAVIVINNKIIARAHNLTERLNVVTAHAEMQAITAAANTLGGKYLKGCTLFVTLEPCVMCGGALHWSQLERVVFAAPDEKSGAGRHADLYHPKTKIIGGVLSEEAKTLLQSFFKSKRN